MEIHKPKPWHGWLEFAKEIGTIVIGVLLAIGAEQMVEVLHHRAQAREMAKKLSVEGDENRHVIAYDMEDLRTALNSADADLDAVTKNTSSPPLVKPNLYRASDVAWVATRDSGLLPIMPKLLTDNAWKVDFTNEAVMVSMRGVGAAADQAEAALSLLKVTPDDVELRRTTRLRLAQLRVEEAQLISDLDFYRRINEQMLRGEMIDTVSALQRAQAGRKSEAH
ncbi:MAG TPA: hypothetical protein VGL66_14870 [Caulobacteraceae bacterium]|jgi:hypothetical protein